MATHSQPDSIGVVFDPAFGIRISNPKVSIDTVNTFCSGMQKIRLSQVSSGRVNPPQAGTDWVTMGVLVEKSECRKSASGNEYMIWRMADLTELSTSSIKVLLFGDCVKEHWKLQPGITLLLNNPQFADPNAKTSEVTLKLSKTGQIIDIGFCPDFAHCQGTKPDGSQCKHFVNHTRSAYCPFHLQQRVRQVAANRGALNRSSNLPPRNWGQFPPRKQLHEELPPGVKMVNRKAENRNTKFAKPLKSLADRAVKAAEAKKEAEREQLDKLAAENPLSMGARSILLQRQRENGGRLVSGQQQQDPRVESRTPAQSPGQQSVRSMREFLREKKTEKSPLIDLNDPSQKLPTLKPINRIEREEQMKIKRAAEILKNGAKKRPRTDGCGEGTDTENEPSGSGLSGVTFSQDQIRQMLAKKSTHDREATQEELHRQNSYFNRRELEEQIESNATSLMEIKSCKVVSCKQCEYTSAHQSSFCQSQGHQVRRHNAVKRFFKCADCHRRTICYDRMPTKPCQHCKSKKWERVAMRDERKVLLDTEQLKIKEKEGNFSSIGAS